MQKELEMLLCKLPSGISECIRQSEAYKIGGGINEIRMRANRHLSLNYKGKNIILSYLVSEEMLSECVMIFCKNSLYSYMDAIKEGYIPFENSIRVGVCGEAVCEGSKIVNVHSIKSLNIRIPTSIYGVGRSLYNKLYEGGFNDSAVIFSPPGIGKTTLLRELAVTLSKGNPPKRVALIDSRYELCDSAVMKEENIDVYSGYPKAKGIELATRTMSPEYIICDEIGAEEADSILSVQSGGVPLIVGAHAYSVEKLIASGSFSKLHKAGIFDLYVKINIASGGERRLDIIPRNEILCR
ncbi:MAG: hypothetical protein E7633_02860 [Ruminococcaceae bacterium]|nr:hypothetical protein [Oscillospiraceae bacterium]